VEELHHRGSDFVVQRLRLLQLMPYLCPDETTRNHRDDHCALAHVVLPSMNPDEPLPQQHRVDNILSKIVGNTGDASHQLKLSDLTQALAVIFAQRSIGLHNTVLGKMIKKSSFWQGLKPASNVFYGYVIQVVDATTFDEFFAMASPPFTVAPADADGAGRELSSSSSTSSRSLSAAPSASSARGRPAATPVPGAKPSSATARATLETMLHQEYQVLEASQAKCIALKYAIGLLESEEE